MKTIRINILILFILAICLISCTQDEIEESIGTHSSELMITTGLGQMANPTKRGPVSAFTEDSKLGLFITKGNLNDDYSSAASRNILSTLTGSTWVQNPSVNLYAHDATIFAYYPYVSIHENGEKMPVESGLTDYMYGTHTLGQSAINKENRMVNLTMNHALALIQFNIYKANYLWQGRLERVSISNAPGKEIVHYSGKLNIQTGEITDMSGTDRNIQTNSSPLLIIPEDNSASEDNYIKLLLIPTMHTTGKGDVIVQFFIDDKEYIWEVPAGTQWEQATKYTYDVQLNGNELRVGDVKIAEWLDGVNGDVILE